MKLHLASTTTQNFFTGYGAGFVLLNGTQQSVSMMVTPDQVITPWAEQGFAGLAAEDFRIVLELKPEIVLLGSGLRFNLLHPATTRLLAAARIGVEVMDTMAACRTYNVLLAEGRRVVAALIIEKQ